MNLVNLRETKYHPSKRRDGAAAAQPKTETPKALQPKTETSEAQQIQLTNRVGDKATPQSFSIKGLVCLPSGFIVSP